MIGTAASHREVHYSEANDVNAQSQPDLFERIRAGVDSAPVWTLLATDIDTLPKLQQQWVRDHLHFLRESGSLACFLTNQRGTKYETVYEPGRGWKLRPVCGCADPSPNFIAEYLEYSPCPEIVDR